MKNIFTEIVFNKMFILPKPEIANKIGSHDLQQTYISLAVSRVV